MFICLCVCVCVYARVCVCVCEKANSYKQVDFNNKHKN